jgi:glycosyltransferase involved in cell wall biosynthesis
MARAIAPVRDLASFLRLFHLFRKERFDVVSVSTPKAALLGCLAARLAGVGNIVYIVRGRIYENHRGVKRWMWEQLEKLSCAAAHSVISISREIANDMRERGVCRSPAPIVLGAGSGNGVDLDLFSRTASLEMEGRAIRDKIGAGPGALVLLYSGRIRSEKGVNEMVDAFRILRERHSNLHLIVQGVYEKSDPLRKDVEDSVFGGDDGLHHFSWTDRNQVFLAAADIVVFPSYREGFGNLALEGAAMELPVVACDVMGCRESVIHEETGLLCTARLAPDLAEALERLIADPDLRRRLGAEGRRRIERDFDSKAVWRRYADHYESLLPADKSVVAEDRAS